MPPLTLDALNAMPRAEAAAALAGIFEHAPWIGQAACDARPFPTVAALHEAMLAVLHDADPQRQLSLIRGHPELGSKLARADLTDASQAEQGSLGLDRLSEKEFECFRQLNAAYREKFGFPFVICVRRHTRDSILAQFEHRLAHDAERERAAALAEIALIARLRLDATVDGPGKPRTDGRLTTHVLDLAAGCPARGVRIALFEIGAGARGALRDAVTNQDGRTDAPLIAGEPLRIGTYELQFHVGDYFAKAAPQHAASAAFLDIVPVRFAIAEPEADYHIPLLVTPFGYASYRGS